jgi:hypothetical protein
VKICDQCYGKFWDIISKGLAELFPVLVRRIVHTSSAAQELRLFLELLFICVTLSCSALHVHRLGVAHQSSLRSSPTMMSFSIPA